MTQHPIRRLISLCILLACILVTPAPSQAVSGPSLRIWSANNGGSADLVPGDSVQVVIEVRSGFAVSGTVEHAAPAGMVFESATASAGTLDTSGPVRWEGDVSPSQPINIVLAYRVTPTTYRGDRELVAVARLAQFSLRASSILRICCGAYRQQLPIIRR